MTEEQQERVTRRDLVEGKIEKVAERGSSVAVGLGGLKFDNAGEMADAARMMAACGPMLPDWLQGNVGGCWGTILRSVEIGISPLTLAQMMFVTEKGGKQRVAYDSVYFRTMIEKFSPLKAPLDCRYEGEGDDMICIVFGTFKGESTPREFPPADVKHNYTLGKLRPGVNQYGQTKGSPLWGGPKASLQMFYAMTRDWGRMHCPHIVAGAYTPDELKEQDFEIVEEPRALTHRTSSLVERLRAARAGDEGFNEATVDQIDKTIEAAREKQPEE